MVGHHLQIHGTWYMFLCVWNPSCLQAIPSLGLCHIGTYSLILQTVCWHLQFHPCNVHSVTSVLKPAEHLQLARAGYKIGPELANSILQWATKWAIKQMLNERSPRTMRSSFLEKSMWRGFIWKASAKRIIELSELNNQMRQDRTACANSI